MSRKGLANYKRLIQLAKDLRDQAIEDYGPFSPEAFEAADNLEALQSESDMAAEQAYELKAGK